MLHKVIWAVMIATGIAGAPAIAAPTNAPPAQATTTTTALKSKFMKVTVAPERRDCQGMFPMKCLVVDGGNFYSNIEGFQFEPGYNYTLMIRETPRSTDGRIIADASLYRYKLVQVYKRNQAK